MNLSLSGLIWLEKKLFKQGRRRAYAWRNGKYGYGVIAEGMDVSRYRLIVETMYEAIMSTLASLGATDMAHLSAAQRGHLNMSKKGVDFIGKALTKEVVSLFAGGGEPGAGGAAGVAQFDLKQMAMQFMMQKFNLQQIAPPGQPPQGGGGPY